MIIMTKENPKFDLAIFLSKIHDSSTTWCISSFYEHCLLKGYQKSKRTFERELLDLGIFPKVLFDEKDLSLKK